MNECLRHRYLDPPLLQDALSANQANAKAMETKGRRQYNQLMAAKEQLIALQATDAELRKQNSELQGVQQQLALELEALRSHCKREHGTEGASTRRQWDAPGHAVKGICPEIGFVAVRSSADGMRVRELDQGMKCI